MTERMFDGMEIDYKDMPDVLPDEDEKPDDDDGAKILEPRRGDSV